MRAGCYGLAEAGARVVVADLHDAKHGSGRFVQHDVTSEDSWKALLADVLKHEGRLDIMVNNAGISGGAGTVETTDLETWQRVMSVTSEGVFLGCQYAIQGMKHTGPAKAEPKGSIVNLSSVAGLFAGSGSIAYTASKGGVRLLTKSVALYCAEKKYAIRCNSVHPGGVDTPIFDGFWQMVGHMSQRQWLEELHPLGRLGRADEVASMILFLLSDESTFSTGSEFVCDGGLTA